MSLGTLYNSIISMSPAIEVTLRKLYWNNVKYLLKFRSESEGMKESSPKSEKEAVADFGKVLTYLKDNGVKEGDVMVIHSSFGALSDTGLDAEAIIDKLFSLVGVNGTLAMPAIRHFPEEGEGNEYILSYIHNEMQGVNTLYDIYRSKVTSGLLPFTLMRYDDAEISRFPLNPLVAIGAKAEEIMKGNVDGELPSAHGPNSAWAHCASLDAWNIGIGVTEKDYLTMFHICQEDEEWPVKDEEWYFERDFTIKKAKMHTPLRIKERKHKWTKYFAESHFYHDLENAGIIRYAKVDGIDVYISRAKNMVDFIKKHPNPTYPYLIPHKYLKK